MKAIFGILLVCVLLLPSGAWAQAQPLTFWNLGARTTLSESDLGSLLHQVSAQEPAPQHVIILIHGWMTPTAQAQAQYTAVARAVHETYQARGERVAVVGLAWNSDVGGTATWVPQYLAHRLASLLFLGSAIADPYLSKVWLARDMGRGSLRQVILALQDRYPDADVDVWCHSMGAEMTRAAVRPHDLDAFFKVPAWAPDARLRLGMIALAGADLDASALLHRDVLPGGPQARLLWLTIPRRAVGEEDVVLAGARVFARRGSQAIGNTMPVMDPASYDLLMSNGTLVFDNEDVPTDHQFLLYYTTDRVQRMTEALDQKLAGKKGLSQELDEVDQVLAAPDRPLALKPFLASPHINTVLYGVWRLEKLVEGSCAHLADGYLYQMVVNPSPRDLENEGRGSPCLLVRDGAWPPPEVTARLNRKAQAQAAASAGTGPPSPPWDWGREWSY